MIPQGQTFFQLALKCASQLFIFIETKKSGATMLINSSPKDFCQRISWKFQLLLLFRLHAVPGIALEKDTQWCKWKFFWPTFSGTSKCQLNLSLKTWLSIMVSRWSWISLVLWHCKGEASNNKLFLKDVLGFRCGFLWVFFNTYK